MPSLLPLVGRDRELQQIAAALGRPEAGGVVLYGPGGVGKTRLGEECLRIGEDAGYDTARVTATASAREIPLGALAPLLSEVGDDTRNLLVAARAELSRRAGGRRWILLVDDAHLLDPASAALVQGLVADGVAFVVATVRAGEATPDAVVALWKDGYAERVDVPPLTDVELHQLASEVVQGRLDPSAERAVRDLAQGNALAARELLTGAVRTGVLARDGATWRLTGTLPVTERLTELIAQRLEGLGTAERDALEIVAVGEPLPVDVASELLDPVAAESLEQQRLVQVRDDAGVVQVWLGHPLHGEILREQIAVFRRRRIVTALVDAVANRSEHDRSALLRVARWRLELGDMSDLGLFADAARWSHQAGDMPSTIELARPVWEREQDGAVGVRLAQALASINRLDEARVVIEAVLAQELDPGLRAFAVITYSGVFMRVGDLETALQFAADQEALLPEPWSSDVRAQSAFLTMQAGRIAEARDLATSIDEMDSPRAAVVVGMTNVLAHAYSGRPLDGIEIAAKWRVRHAELWQTEPLPADPSGALLTELMAKYAAGYFAEAEPLLRASYEQTLAGGPAQTLGPQTLAIGICALETGRLTEAIDWFRRSFDLMAAAGPNQYGDWAAAGMLTAAAQLRDLETVDEALAMLESFDATEFGMGRTNHLIALGWLHLVRGDTHAARTVLGGAVEDALDRGALTFAVDALHTLARTGLVDSIVADPDELAPRIQGPILEAKLEHTAGRIANDPERLERAAAGFDAIGARLYAAEALFDAARAHRRAGDQRAATVADRRAQALAAACPGARTPALHTTDEIVPLTDRERELALLAADGLSTKEIAERLFLSARTVQNHLNRAYEKLGVSGRRELRRALAIPDPDAPGAD